MYLKYLFSEDRKIKNNLKLLKHYSYIAYFNKRSMYHATVTIENKIPYIREVMEDSKWLIYVYGYDAAMDLYNNYPVLSREEYLIFLTNLIKQYEYKEFKRKNIKLAKQTSN